MAATKKASPAAAKGKAAPAKAPAKSAAPAPVVAAPTPSAAPTAVHKIHSFRRKIIGVVTSDKMDKTVVVSVNRYHRDRVYKKYVKRRLKYKAHDERNEYKVGDRVEIQEHAPYSREKRFQVVRLIVRPVSE